MIGAFAPLASFALFHMVTVFPLSWVFLFTQRGARRASSSSRSIGAVVRRRGDHRLGHRSPTGSAGARCSASRAVAIAVFSGFAPQLLDGGVVGEIDLHGGRLRPARPVLRPVLGRGRLAFSPAYRYTGSALTSDLAWLFGAGFAPLVALLLSSHFGLISAGAYLLVRRGLHADRALAEPALGDAQSRRRPRLS